ncbi:MAG TPA: hypothetical protein VED59_01690 [Acidimicrobiales bacterium]|nr:hypothetical protein [Acidimicrobiales bacterium]
MSEMPKLVAVLGAALVALAALTASPALLGPTRAVVGLRVQGTTPPAGARQARQRAPRAGLPTWVSAPASKAEGPQPLWAHAATATSFANEVLVAAPLPPGTVPWHGAVPSEIGHPTAGYIGTTSDLHRFYGLSPDGAARLPGYVTRRLGVRPSSTQSSVTDRFGFYQFVAYYFRLPTWGPHEYFAQLEYALATTSGQLCPAAGGPRYPTCLVRLDSVTTWEPGRPASEIAPEDVPALLTGYRSTVPAGWSGPVTVAVSPAKSAALARVLNSLPLGPGTACMDCVLLYQLTFQARGRHSQVVDAQGWGPPYAVLVRVGGSETYRFGPQASRSTRCTTSPVRSSVWWRSSCRAPPRAHVPQVPPAQPVQPRFSPPVPAVLVRLPLRPGGCSHLDEGHGARSFEDITVRAPGSSATGQAGFPDGDNCHPHTEYPFSGTFAGSALQLQSERDRR